MKSTPAMRNGHGGDFFFTKLSFGRLKDSFHAFFYKKKTGSTVFDKIDQEDTWLKNVGRNRKRHAGGRLNCLHMLKSAGCIPFQPEGSGLRGNYSPNAIP
jgi:hypothetical protein